MERVIGIFGSLLNQPSNPFANLTEHAKKIAEVNAITSMWPDLERVEKDPRGSIDLGDGYILLGPKDAKAYRLSLVEQNALAAFYSSLPNPSAVPRRSIYRWARLKIPAGQIARSYWKEVVRTSKAARSDRNLKVRIRDLISLMFQVFDIRVTST
jgi:hypothetical protein